MPGPLCHLPHRCYLLGVEQYVGAHAPGPAIIEQSHTPKVAYEAYAHKGI